MSDANLAIKLIDDYAALAAVAIPPLGTRCLDVNSCLTSNGCCLVKGPMGLPRARNTPKDVDRDIRTVRGDGVVLIA
jgi:hypothetical protein